MKKRLNSSVNSVSAIGANVRFYACTVFEKRWLRKENAVRKLRMRSERMDGDGRRFFTEI